MTESSWQSRMTRCLDAGQVEELRNIPGEGELDLFADVAGLFLQTTPALLKSLSEGLARGDLADVARQAHMLKGSSSNLGAFVLTDLSHQLEQAALRGETGGEKLFGEIASHYVLLSTVLAEIMADSSE